jgi:hypothetical protein
MNIITCPKCGGHRASKKMAVGCWSGKWICDDCGHNYGEIIRILGIDIEDIPEAKP